MTESEKRSILFYAEMIAYDKLQSETNRVDWEATKSLKSYKELEKYLEQMQ